MRTIVIRVPAADLAAEMAAMRKWLDEDTCEPSSPDYASGLADVAQDVDSV